MRVLNAMQLKNGAKAESGPTFSSLTQPTQFLPFSKRQMIGLLGILIG